MTRTVEVLGGTLVLREPSPIAFITLTMGSFTVTAMGDKMAYTLPADKQVRVKVAYVDANGNPATVDGDVTWQSSDDAIVTVTAEAGNSFQALIVPGDSVGQAQITARADADLGTGVRELNTLMDVTVIAGEAVAGVISPVGEPEPIP